MKYYCNPINVPYRYQFNADPRSTGIQVDREAADPSMICFKGKYYIFASMNLSVWVSEDLVNWESHRLPDMNEWALTTAFSRIPKKLWNSSIRDF